MITCDKVSGQHNRFFLLHHQCGIIAGPPSSNLVRSVYRDRSMRLLDTLITEFIGTQTNAV